MSCAEGEGEVDPLLAPAHSCLNAAIDITRQRSNRTIVSVCFCCKRLSLSREREKDRERGKEILLVNLKITELF